MNSPDPHEPRREGHFSTNRSSECFVCGAPVGKRGFCQIHPDDGGPIMVCCPDCANQYVDSRRVYDNREIAALHCTGQAEVMNTRPLNLSGAKADTRVRSLVVHDSQFMLKILAQTLQQAGDFRLVGAATDAYQALRYVSAFSPELVLMGVHMPGLTGIHATRYIKQAEHSPVVILISSHNSTVAKLLAEQAGADGLVSTQGNFRHRLIRMLKNLLGSTAGRRVAANSVRFEDPLGRQPNQEYDK